MLFYLLPCIPMNKPSACGRYWVISPRLILPHFCDQLAPGCFSFTKAVRAQPTFQARVNQVPSSIAEHIDAKYRQTERQALPENHPGSIYHIATPFTTNHSTPARIGRRQSQSQKAE